MAGPHSRYLRVLGVQKNPNGYKAFTSGMLARRGSKKEGEMDKYADNAILMRGLTDALRNAEEKTEELKGKLNNRCNTLNIELGQITEPLSVESFLLILKNCRKIKYLESAKSAYTHICTGDFGALDSVGNHIVPTFVGCGGMLNAQQLFNSLIDRKEHSWTSLLEGYIASGQPRYALKMYQKMQEDTIEPSSYTLTALLKACARLRDVETGQKIHVKVAAKGLESDLFISNTLIDMYAKCGLLAEAKGVFGKLPVQGVIAWTALISGYAEKGLGYEALDCFEQMRLNGVLPDAATFLCILKVCGSVGAIEKGQEVHAEVSRNGFARNPIIGSALVDMYVKCGTLAEAQKVFDNLLFRDVVCWTTLISGYLEHGSGQKALECFEQMQEQGVFPSSFTYVCGLKACAKVQAINKVREIHAETIQKSLQRGVFIGNSLVELYFKCGSLAEAMEVFDKLPFRDVVSWNILIAGYTDIGQSFEARKCLDEMQLEGGYPDAGTIVCLLKSYGGTGAIERGREIHAEMLRKGLKMDLTVGSALVDMYAKCDSLGEARNTFEEMPVRDIIAWTALITAYVENDSGHEALKCFEHMKLNGISPNLVTLLCTLKACGSTGAIDKGRELHNDITKKGFGRDPYVSNTLIDMYAKCGSLGAARDAFDRLPVQDVVSWNAMLRGYGTSHEAHLAIQCFQSMQEQRIKPDVVTFTCLLSACSRAGLIYKGQEYFELMRAHGIAPSIDHYTCMVDLLARSGRLSEAEQLLETAAPSKDAWTALLSSCKTYGEVGIGVRCFQRLVQMDPHNAATYVLMANIYITAGNWDEAKRVEDLRKLAGARKKPAKALIEIGKKVHEFVVGDNLSEKMTAILESLKARLKERGYVPDLDVILKPISNEEKEVALCGHAEKLAIVFGLLHTPQGQTLRATKNLRMCNDCHNVGKIISKTEKREIVVRENNWVHYFKDGLCSCGDMW